MEKLEILTANSRHNSNNLRVRLIENSQRWEGGVRIISLCSNHFYKNDLSWQISLKAPTKRSRILRGKIKS